MKEITQYQCETCGTIYNNEDTCAECENFHIAVESVAQYKYNPKEMGPESRYPYAVVIKMDNGQELIFKR